jgi:hypothetical protein
MFSIGLISVDDVIGRIKVLKHGKGLGIWLEYRQAQRGDVSSAA